MNTLRHAASQLLPQLFTVLNGAFGESDGPCVSIGK